MKSVTYERSICVSGKSTPSVAGGLPGLCSLAVQGGPKTASLQTSSPVRNLLLSIVSGCLHYRLNPKRLRTEG